MKAHDKSLRREATFASSAIRWSRSARRMVNSTVRSFLLNPLVDFTYPESIKGFSPPQRLHFYELLAHNLTVSVRAIWSNENVSDGEKVDRIRLINEIQHHVTSKVYVLRLQLHEWTEEDSWKMITDYVAQNRGIESDVDAAIRLSYECAARY
jgi:hypothetical protein